MHSIGYIFKYIEVYTWNIYKKEKNTHTNSISSQQSRWVSIILSRYIRKSKTENTAFTLTLLGQYIRLILKCKANQC